MKSALKDGRPYLAYIDKNGKAYKPLVVQQKNRNIIITR